jgi:hypothetical protein
MRPDLNTVAFAATLALGAVLAVMPACAGTSGTAKGKTTGAAAAGDPKPFDDYASAVCVDFTCIVDFGKRPNKERAVHWINCVITTEGGIAYLASAIADFGESKNKGGFSAVSRATAGTKEFAVFQYTNPLTIPAGNQLLVGVQTTGTSGTGHCTLGGTIR